MKESNKSSSSSSPSSKSNKQQVESFNIINEIVNFYCSINDKSNKNSLVRCPDSISVTILSQKIKLYAVLQDDTM